MKPMVCHKSGFKKYAFWILLGFLYHLNAQPVATYSPIRDTSFTLHSNYLKEKKKYPFIEIARSSHPMVPQPIAYKKLDNRSLFLDAYLVAASGLKPAVFLLHGGGWKSGDKKQMEALAGELTAKGFHCFAVEYRLSPEAIYPAALTDVQDAIRYVIKNASQLKVDVHKIAVLGCSSGAQMASLIGVKGDYLLGNHATAKVNAIVNIDGILAFHHPESEEKDAAALWLGGTYEEIPSTWMEASALTHVNKHSPPILFINSAIRRFHAGRDDMIHKLNSFGIYSKITIVPDAPHTFWFYHPWFEKIVVDITDFLNEVFYIKSKYD